MKTKTNSKKFSVRNLLNNLFLVLAVLIFLFTLCFAWINGSSKNDTYIFGFKPYIITSGSMAPEIETNSLALLKQVPYKDIKVGDIISYRSASYDLPVLHRVIEIGEDGFTTKGDNVKIPDAETITPDMFRGKLIANTNFFAGYITFVQVKGVFLGVVLPLLVLLAIIFALFLLPKKKSKEHKPEETQLEKEDE
jgi:signal peptidase